MAADIQYKIHFYDCQQRLNNFKSCIPGDQYADRLHTALTQIRPSIICKIYCNTLPATSLKWASTLFQHVSCVISAARGFIQCETMFWLPVYYQEKTKPSLAHLGNEHHRSINHFRSCILVYLSGSLSQSSIYKNMASIRVKYVQDIAATSSGTLSS